MSVTAPLAEAIEGDDPALAEPTILRPLLVIASLGAAAIHFAFAPVHFDENTVHGAFFLVIAWLQLGWAFAVARQPSRLSYRFGIMLNLAILGVWLISRTVGINGVVEPFGLPDSVAAALEAFIVVGSFRPLARRLPRTPMADLTRGMILGGATIGIAALASASMLPSLSGHAAGAAHQHGTTAVVDEAAPHDHSAQAEVGSAASTDASAHVHTSTVAVPYDPTKPVNLGGVPGVTAKQQAEAEKVVTETLKGLPQWKDPAVAEAAGFRSIGDAYTGTEHLINQANMDDDTILDPDKPESLVYDIKDGKRSLAAAMYMLKRGTPLADVPKLGGSLMQWHTHQNLCYNADGKVAGITGADGTCPRGLVKPAETPMIHVWIRANECGPFAALEGIGAGAIAPGETRLCDTAHGS